MKERIIVTLTTWHKRIDNIPSVLDTIYGQTLPPDIVVLNLAYDEIVPPVVHDYIEQHGIEVNRVPDTKVYKKLIPTLKKYPEDCVISIDDDWLYPKDMIVDFMQIHKQYPNHPISGNRVVECGIQCHCGCASLTKANYFGNYLNIIDEDVIRNCPSDDMVYSYFATINGHPYVRTINMYFTNMQSYNPTTGYSDKNRTLNIIKTSYNYLVNRFGSVDNGIMLSYIKNQHMAELVQDIYSNSINFYIEMTEQETEEKIYSSYSFRIGQSIVLPFRWVKIKLKQFL